MDQTEKTVTIQQHPEEEAHHENGTSKMFRKVKASAKKFKISNTKHGESHEHDDHDVVEEDDEDDELEPEVIGVPVTDQPKEANVSAPEKIVPPGTKVFPVESSDYTKPIEPVPLQDTSYGHEVLSDPVRMTDTSDKEQRREELTNRDESREAHHEPMDTHVSLLPATEDVTSTEKTGPGLEKDLLTRRHEFDRQTESGIGKDSPKRFVAESGAALGEDFSTTELKRDLPTGTHDQFSPELSRPKERDDFEETKDETTHQTKPSTYTERLAYAMSYVQKVTGTVMTKLPLSGGGSGVEETQQGEGKTVSARDYLSGKLRPGEEDKALSDGKSTFAPGGEDEDLGDQRKVNVEIPKTLEEDSVTSAGGSDYLNGVSKVNVLTHEGGEAQVLGLKNGELGAKLGEDSPTRSYESDQKKETEINKNSLTGFGSASIVGLGEGFPAESHELGLKNESGSGKDSPTGYGVESGTSLGEDFRAKESHGYGEESEAGLENNFPARSDDVKVEKELGRDLPTETHDQFSPEISRPKERDDFEESRDSFEETRDETQKPKQSTYTEQFASGGDETQVAETFDEKLTPDKETGSTVTPELPLSGSGSGSDLEKKQQGEVEKGESAKDYLAEKLTPVEEDKALSDMTSDKHHLGGEKKTTTKEVEVPVEKIPSEKEPEEKEHGEAVAEEAKGGGVVGMIKGCFGVGATEEGKPKSPHSAEESSQSLGSTVGTTGFSDSGRSELRETGGGGSGVVPVRRELGN